MGKFVVAIVVLKLFCVIHPSNMRPLTDRYDSLYDLDSFGYDDVYPLGHWGPYHSGGSGYSNLGAYGGNGFSNLGIHGGNGFSSLGTYGGRGYSDLGMYGGSGYSNLRTYLSDYSRLGQYHLGDYNSLYDTSDFGYGNLLRRYSSVGSYQPRRSKYLGSYNDIGGYSNLEPYLFGGYNTGNDAGPLNYLQSSYIRDDKYGPGGYSLGNRKIRRGKTNKNTY
ncbi:hypothetical protein CHS0354_007607 [Potamilus streckersoni]|uniref:Uncharacterized protein n=1 Tax=Potamilus streckersoni TaxID=2493646 RepID=A0AAE0T3W3_9BIVA|nr:hypothetical protein CHS0354_007607 [Potamilus streckersoni]